MFKRTLNQKGFSLVSAMVGVALTGIVTMGVMSLSQNMAQVTQTSDIRSQAQEETFLLQSSLGSEETCNANFAGKEIRANDENGIKLADDLVIPGVRTGWATYAPPTFLLASQNPDNNTTKLKVKEVRLKRYPGSSNLAVIQVTYKAKNGQLMELKPREIPMQVEYSRNNPNRIRRCATTQLLDTSSECDADGNCDTDPANNKKQGNACNSPPPEIKADKGVPTNPGKAPSVMASDVAAVLDKLCNEQNYGGGGLTGGLKVPKGDINDCLNDQGQPKNDRCMALIDIVFGETMMGTPRKVDDHVFLKNRTGYEDKAECKKQKNYSEGDIVMRLGDEKVSEVKKKDYKPGKTYITAPSRAQYVCTGGHWIRLERQPASKTTAAEVEPDFEYGDTHSCFIPETRITLMDGSTKAISEISAGEVIRGQRGGNIVVGIEKVPLGSRKLYSINGGKAFVTSEHPFMTPNGWRSFDPRATAKENPNLRIEGALGVGSVVLQNGHWVMIESFKAESSKSVPWVYNLLLDGDHTYVADGYLVHNKGADNDTSGGVSGSSSSSGPGSAE